MKKKKEKEKIITHVKCKLVSIWVQPHFFQIAVQFNNNRQVLSLIGKLIFASIVGLVVFGLSDVESPRSESTIIVSLSVTSGVVALGSVLLVGSTVHLDLHTSIGITRFILWLVFWFVIVGGLFVIAAV